MKTRAFTCLVLGVQLFAASVVVPGAEPRDEVNRIRAAAERGDAEAQYRLGERFLAGNGMPKDATEAAKWYRKGAEQGYAQAQNALGVCYGTGRGVEKNAAEAIRWYRKAAEQGLAVAQSNLGSHYRDGTGVPRSYENAVLWYRKAAEQGHPKALNELGLCYERGTGVQTDLVQAYLWASLAAERGVAEAKARLDAIGAKLSHEQVTLSRQLASDTLPGLAIDSLYYRPNPAMRGREGWMGVVYRTYGEGGTIHESWSLLHDGQAPFPPIQLDFTPADAAARREIPLPIPAAAESGDYKVVLRATQNGKTVSRETAFRVE